MSRPVKRRHVRHAAVAAELRARPGVWAPVGQYPNRMTADRTAHRIRSGYEAEMYQPAGAFQARVELTDLGARVVARYVGDSSLQRATGPKPKKKPGASIQPMRDCDRVVGQIERGEVLAGPEGARAIAAKHEAAYGDVWNRNTTWADAIASLGGAE
jgi:hypothetical protein